MDIFQFDRDIRLYCTKAASFPEGICDAQERLHELVPFDTDRIYAALSRPEQGQGIVYYAGASELTAGELSSKNLIPLTMRSGGYLYLDVDDYSQHPEAIGAAFRSLLQQGGLDPVGYCVEWYRGKDTCRCMVRQNMP